MVAFLDCVQQFKEEVEKGDTGFCLPYRSDNQDNTHSQSQGFSFATRVSSQLHETLMCTFNNRQILVGVELNGLLYVLPVSHCTIFM